MAEICEACQGTGIEEGREWDGHRCAECHGVGHKTYCEHCGNEIDPDCCDCGGSKEQHDASESGHSFIPMGCDCGRSAHQTEQKP